MERRPANTPRRAHERIVGETPLKAPTFISVLPGGLRALTANLNLGECALIYSHGGQIEVLPTPAEFTAAASSTVGWGLVFSPLSWQPDDEPHHSEAHLERKPPQAISYQVPPDAQPLWEQLLDRLSEEARASHVADTEAARCILALLEIELGRLAARQGTLSYEESRTLAAVGEIIDRRYSERLSLSEVARHVALSPSHLARIVRRSSGQTIGEWIRGRRMEEARRLLRSSDATVESVASTVGYQDITHFRRHFQRAHGSTPARWRTGVRTHLHGRVR